jgi:transposase
MEQVQLLVQRVEEINQALAVARAQDLLAEIGPTAEAFPSGEQFASWVGVCPGSQESAGVCYSRRSPKGNRYLRRLLCQMRWAAARTKETFFAGLFARLSPKISGKGAAWAVASDRESSLVDVAQGRGIQRTRDSGRQPAYVEAQIKQIVARVPSCRQRC